MKVQHDKNATMTSAWITAGIGAVLGLLLILIPVGFLLKLVFTVMGIVTVLSNLPGLAQGIGTFSTPMGKVSLISSAIAILIGCLMIFWDSGVLMIVLGVYMILLPLINVLLSKNPRAQIKAELPKLILGVVLVLLGPAGTFELLFDIAGWCVIALSVFYVITVYLTMRKHQNTPGTRVFVDTDGNGIVDTVYVDTTGDGKADTATNYKEEQ
jgi:hypothetical protein